ncbi:MAG: phage holin family protein, partial [Clostridiales bacterium]|nr:phage holin family protein [Clostridiales bacterium]
MKDFFFNAWDILLRCFGAAAGVFGGGSIRALALLMGLDYGFGIVLGLMGKSRKSKDGRLSARASFQGLLEKGMMLSVILLAAFLDRLAGQDDLLHRAATGFYICNEGISLLENAALLGVPVPGKIR